MSMTTSSTALPGIIGHNKLIYFYNQNKYCFQLYEQQASLLNILNVYCTIIF